MATIESLHYKFMAKLNILENVGYYLQNVTTAYEESSYFSSEKVDNTKGKNYARYMDLLVGESNHIQADLNKIIIEIARIKANYNTGASPLLSLYYDTPFVTTVKTPLLLQRSQTASPGVGTDVDDDEILETEDYETQPEIDVESDEEEDEEENEDDDDVPTGISYAKILEDNPRVKSGPSLPPGIASNAVMMEIHNKYNTFIMSENILDQMDQCMGNLSSIVEGFRKSKEFRAFITSKPNTKKTPIDLPVDDLAALTMRLASMRLEKIAQNVTSYADFFVVFQKQCEEYIQNKLTLTVKKEPVSDCSCGGKMDILPDTSELRCSLCGMIVTLEGTVFEDSQFYTQQGQCTKHKKYDAKRHCKKWLDQIQAKENKNFPPELIAALNERAKKYYTRGGKLRPMTRMRCSQIRDWLKDIGQTDYNPHAPLLRKIITSENGNAVIPPQLSYDEEQRVLVKFARAMDMYDQLMEKKLTNVTNNRRPNKPYYPYVLFKILHMELKKGNRLDGLIECIHLQSDSTLKNHDTIWKEICDNMGDEKDFAYKPTDRTILIDVF